MATANDRQVGGEHYKDGELPQHWDLVDMYGWDYFQGQITKYLMRWRKKNGIQDLEKAAHFLQKYIELESAKAAHSQNASRSGGESLQRQSPSPNYPHGQ